MPVRHLAWASALSTPCAALPRRLLPHPLLLDAGQEPGLGLRAQHTDLRQRAVDLSRVHPMADDPTVGALRVGVSGSEFRCMEAGSGVGRVRPVADNFTWRGEKRGTRRRELTPPTCNFGS